MNKRLELLKQMVSAGQADSFAHYALALEYRKEGLFTEAVETFNTLRRIDPPYLPMYLMAGQTLAKLDRLNEARDWLTAGIVVATAQGNSQTLGELQGELAQISAALR